MEVPLSKNTASQLRSRGCYVLFDVPRKRVFLWYGSKCTKTLSRAATVAAKKLKKR